MIDPVGRHALTGPRPFALAVSREAKRVVAADTGPYGPSLTIMERNGRRLVSRRISRDRRSRESERGESGGAFVGVAFDRDDDSVFASEGESGRVRQIKLPGGRALRTYNLNQNGFSESYTGDLAFDEQRQMLYVVDQANARLAIIDTRRKRLTASIGVGRLPFALALSPDRQRVYVTNLGMFEYLRIPGTDPEKPRDTWLPFPPFGFPSSEAETGVQRKTYSGVLKVPGLGNPNLVQANSVCVIDVSDPAKPRIESFVKTGLPVGDGKVHGGSGPSGVLATEDRVFVSNANHDSITVIDARTLRVATQIPLRIRGLEQHRGLLPMGLAFHEPTGWLLVAEAGINAIEVIDTNTLKSIGHIPAGWLPVRVAVQNDNVYVANVRGYGTGPNAGLYGPLPRTFQADMRRGSISLYPLPGASDLPKLTESVMELNGFLPLPSEPSNFPTAIRHVVVIVKGNRTHDEVLGDITMASNGLVKGSPALARFGRAGTAVVDRKSLQPRLSRRGVNITPNHHAIASRWAFSDNFHADSETSAEGHHWLTGAYPNAWSWRRLAIHALQGVIPEELPETGALWHHLERNGISFRNFGIGLQLPGVYEGPGLQPTGARFATNVPLPEPLFQHTSRKYPHSNMNIPDQFRASQFIREVEERYRPGGEDFPKLVYIHLPNDRITQPRPDDGYPFAASYIADNDYALGRIVEYLSHSPWWREMAILVTESSAQGGVDHVDSHRTILLAIGPYAKRNYASHVNVSFPGLLKTIFRLLRIPPLHLFDATAADLSDCFTLEADFSSYKALRPDEELFQPEAARDPFDREPAIQTNDR